MSLAIDPLLVRIVAAAVLAAVAAGVVGSFVVVRNISSVAGGLAHAAFGGVGLGFLLGVDPLASAAVFAVGCGAGIGLLYRKLEATLDASISMFWSGGMALGVVAIALSPGYAPDLSSYLFGSLLFVSWDFVAFLALLDLVLLAIVALLYRRLEAVVFDEEFAEVVGIPVDAIFVALMALVGLAVVALMRVVGVILAIALLTVPATMARTRATSMRGVMAIAVAVGAAAATAGVGLSWAVSAGWGVSIPTGPLIVLITLAAYGASLAWPRRAGADA
jgi:zinc transport system permease protein